MITRALVVGGASGIGLSIATRLASREECQKVYIVDRAEVPDSAANPKFEYHKFDLMSEDFSLFDGFEDVDTVMITAGFGRLALFESVSEDHITSSMTVNATAAMRIIHHFYHRLNSTNPFRLGVMVSIAGYLSSPFFAVYGASKAALRYFIESLNVELEKGGAVNKILNVSPGSIKGTSFGGGATDLAQTEVLAEEIITHLEAGDDLFIPQYDEVYKNVLERYHEDFREEGRRSYEYKLKSGRVK